MSRFIQEIDIRLNKLEYSNTGNVTTSAQTIEEIFTDIPAAAKTNMKTLIIHNTDSTNAVYMGDDNSTTTANGVPIYAEKEREVPMKNLELSPYFIAGATVDIRIEIWS
jgi:hypothetical protein